VSADTVTIYRVLLSLIGIGLSFGYYLYYLRDRATPKRIYTAVLILCAVFGLYLYLELGPQFQLQRTTVKRMTNPHDFYHYYIGSKYFRELGYFDLYECSAVADQQQRKALRPDWKIRDLRTYRYRTISSLADRPRYCQELFSAKRWRSFGRDIEVLSGWLSPRGWNTALKDKGYNATPVWTMVAARFSNLVPLESAAGVFWLLSFDWVFSLAIFVGVGLAYGWRPALLVAVFFGLNSLSATGFVKGSLSRLDWLACLVLAVCLIKRGRYLPAGLLAGVSTSLRIFPGLFLVGLAFKAIWTVYRTRTVPRNYLQFFGAVAVSIGLLLGATALTSKGRARWQDFGTKITSHDRQIAGYRVGFKYAMLDVESTGRGKAREVFESAPKRAVWWTVQLLMLATVFVAAQRLRDHDTIALSFVCVYFLTAPTFYYYQMLVVPFLLFLPERSREGTGLGMAVFFGWNTLGYMMMQIWPLGFRLSHWLSWSLFGLSAWLVIAVLARGPETDPARS
jgi:hypothetical protein